MGAGVVGSLQQKSSTGPSRVVPHRSTTPARYSLTALFGWEAVSLDDTVWLLYGRSGMILHKLFFIFSFLFDKTQAQMQTVWIPYQAHRQGSWQMLLATATARAAALAASAAAPHAATPA